VYVPVYSSIYLGIDVRQKNTELAATVSVRNVTSGTSRRSSERERELLAR
jgi:hypothetical protein